MNINKLDHSIDTNAALTGLQEQMHSFDFLLEKDFPQFKDKLSFNDEVSVQLIDEKMKTLNELVYRAKNRIEQLHQIKDAYALFLEHASADILNDEDGDVTLTNDILLKNGFVRPEPVSAPHMWVLYDSVDGSTLIKLYRISNAFAMNTTGMTIAVRTVKDLRRLYRVFGMSAEIKV